MTYIQRLAQGTDLIALASLWQSFIQEREKVDPSTRCRFDFDYLAYVTHRLKQPLSFCYVLESGQELVGFLDIYFYDEAPPPQIPLELSILENPFIPRRVGAVLGLYVQPIHQHPQAIKLLTDAALTKAEELKVTDIDLLVSDEQKGIHALLMRYGFTKSAVQFTKHFEISGGNLPGLHNTVGLRDQFDACHYLAIPLRDPITNETVKDPHGAVIHLQPLSDQAGNTLRSSNGMPVYPLPLRDPQTQQWVFDDQGKLVFCPVMLADDGTIVEKNGLPQFLTPDYSYQAGCLMLVRDDSGNYLFKEPKLHL